MDADIGMMEICICAAVRTPDGLVIRGHRHHHALRALAGMRVGSRHGIEQGFVTSLNRFVSRESGLNIQLSAGVPSANPEGYHASMLFSEDLY